MTLPLVSVFALSAVLACAAFAQEAPRTGNSGGAKTVVAHRGASGYLPEHTLACYAAAHSMGADYIEPDVLLTRDGILVCLHDLYLESTTDADALFPDRKRADGHWYAADFDLAEIKRLTVRGRMPKDEVWKEFPGFRVPTLEELILLVRGLNAKTGRKTGLLIETKSADFHDKEGKPLEKPLLALLDRYGYRDRDCGIIIQSFGGPHLKKLKTELKTELPLMYLTGTALTPEQVDEVATYAVGLNPSRRAVETLTGGLVNEGKMLRRAKERGLKVFVWTFDAEDAAMQRFLWQYGVDGVITNHPDAGVRAARQAPAK